MGRAEMRALTRPVRGSIRTSRPSAPFGVTHTEPAPTASLQGSPGKRVGSPTTRFDLGSMRQTAGAGRRVSAHTHPPPVATETGDPGKPIRATIAALLREGDGALPVELGGADEALARPGGSGEVVEQPDAAAATARARAAAYLDQVSARVRGTRMLGTTPDEPVRFQQMG